MVDGVFGTAGYCAQPLVGLVHRSELEHAAPALVPYVVVETELVMLERGALVTMVTVKVDIRSIT